MVGIVYCSCCDFVLLVIIWGFGLVGGLWFLSCVCGLVVIGLSRLGFGSWLLFVVCYLLIVLYSMSW